MPCWLLPVNRGGTRMLPGVSLWEWSQQVPKQHVQPPAGVASTWEDSQGNSGVYILLTATSYCGALPSIRREATFKRSKDLSNFFLPDIPPFLSHHQRPGSHIKKNWKQMTKVKYSEFLSFAEFFSSARQWISIFKFPVNVLGMAWSSYSWITATWKPSAAGIPPQGHTVNSAESSETSDQKVLDMCADNMLSH